MAIAICDLWQFRKKQARTAWTDSLHSSSLKGGLFPSGDFCTEQKLSVLWVKRRDFRWRYASESVGELGPQGIRQEDKSNLTTGAYR